MRFKRLSGAIDIFHPSSNRFNFSSRFSVILTIIVARPVFVTIGLFVRYISYGIVLEQKFSALEKFETRNSCNSRWWIFFFERVDIHRSNIFLKFKNISWDLRYYPCPSIYEQMIRTMIIKSKKTLTLSSGNWLHSSNFTFTLFFLILSVNSCRESNENLGISRGCDPSFVKIFVDDFSSRIFITTFFLLFYLKHLRDLRSHNILSSL